MGWRVERRTEPGRAVWYRLGAILVGLGIAALAVPLNSDASGSPYSQVWRATFGTAGGLENVLTLATTLIFTGLAVAIPLRMRLWNIGGEGQLIIGAWAAIGIAFALPTLTGVLLIPLMLVVAALSGMLWILVPALSRAFLGVNEIVTTLLLNFIAFFWMVFWVTGSWGDPFSSGGIQSRRTPDQAELSLVSIGSVEIHWGLFLGVALAVVLWLLFRMTSVGYEVSILRGSIKAGEYAGMHGHRRLVMVMLVGGAMGGLAGAVEMLGNIHRLSDTLSNNTGLAGVVVAVLAGGSEIGVVAMAILFAWLIAGGNALRTAGVSSDAVFALMGVILLLAAIGSGLARYRVARVKGPEGPRPGDLREHVVGRGNGAGGR